MTQEMLRKNEKVSIITNAETKEIFGTEFVQGLKYIDRTSGAETFLHADGVFVAIGMRPNSDMLDGLVKKTPLGNIIVDPHTLQASTKGIWAAGDITDSPYNQINTAIGEAVKAVLNIYETLSRGEL